MDERVPGIGHERDRLHPCGDPAGEAGTGGLRRHPTPPAVGMLPYHRACVGTFRGSHFFIGGRRFGFGFPFQQQPEPEISKMRLSRAGFFADFYVYPAVAGAFVTVAIVTARDRWLAWSSAIVFGVFIWTIFEYLLHRYVLHHVPWIREMHDAHHKEQKALIGTPTYLTVSLMLVTVALPSILIAGPAVGSCFTAGIVLGYLWYVVVHYGLHNWNIKPKSYLSRLKR